MKEKETDSFCPTSRLQWRRWLQKHHAKKQSVWLVYYKKTAGAPTITYNEAVDEALCFGWIDSTRKSLGNDSFTQFFCRRKPNSVWSKINKGKVERLIAEGLMAPAGHESIATAKSNGSWSVLDDVEELKIPRDLSSRFRLHPGSKAYFTGLSRSVKKAILQWLVLAKRPETREKRIDEIATLAAQKMKPKQF